MYLVVKETREKRLKVCVGSCLCSASRCEPRVIFRPLRFCVFHFLTTQLPIGMLTQLRHILEMIRFSHTLFALPFAMLAAALAWRQNEHEGRPFRWQELAGILLCMV